MTAPIPFVPRFESLEDDEAQTSFDLQTTMRSISTKTYEGSGRALRSVHAKTHGLLVGELTVETGLPDAYAQGLFAQPGTYPVVMRLRAAPQKAHGDDLACPVDDGMQFNPWHALAAHRPLGSIMRVRKAAYAMSKRFPIAEPRDVEGVKAAARR